MLAAQNADFAETTMGVTYLSFIRWLGHVQKTVYIHHKHISTCPNHMNICLSFHSEIPESFFHELEPGTHEPLKTTCVISWVWASVLEVNLQNPASDYCKNERNKSVLAP